MSEPLLITADMYGARTEEIVLTLTLDKALVAKHADALANIPYTPVVLQDEDVLKINYTLHATYWKVFKALAAIETLLDEPGVVRTGDIKELKHGRCLFLEVARKLDRIIEHTEKQDPAP